jgi:hypothetical protein
MSIKKEGSRTGQGKELEALALICQENPILRKRVSTILTAAKKKWAENEKKKRKEGNAS